MGILDLFRKSPEERVARRYIEHLRRASVVGQLDYDRAEAAVVQRDPDGKRVSKMYLGNLIKELGQAPESEHEAIYARFSAGMAPTQSGETYEQARSSLCILLKDATYPAISRLQLTTDFTGNAVDPTVWEPVAADIIACAVLDRPDSMMFVTQENLAKWGVDAAQVLADARANLCALPWEAGQAKIAKFIHHDDSYIASRLLNTGIFETPPSLGEWVAVVPDRNTLFYTDSEDVRGLTGLARLARQQLEAGERTISARPVVFRGGRWEAFEPPDAVKLLLRIQDTCSI